MLPVGGYSLDDLNPGIRRTVALLRAHGFDTCDSGDGETHEHACDRDVGYVVILVADPRALAAEADRVVEVLRGAGVVVQPLGMELEPGITHVQASYDPADGTAVIDISPIHDRQLRSEL